MPVSHYVSLEVSKLRSMIHPAMGFAADGPS